MRKVCPALTSISHGSPDGMVARYTAVSGSLVAGAIAKDMARSSGEQTVGIDEAALVLGTRGAAMLGDAGVGVHPAQLERLGGVFRVGIHGVLQSSEHHQGVHRRVKLDVV